MEILLLEDDPLLCETLEMFLKEKGYLVDTAHDMQTAEDLTFEKRYDLYLLDINLPEGSGLELLENLRFAEDETPTIFITALHDLEAIEKSFSLGAIDYIKKPFEPEELLIRIKAKFKNETIRYGKVEYDPKNDLIRKDGKVIDLGNVPHTIFVTLLKHQGEVVSKETLCECLDHHSDTALRVAITKIKQRLGINVTNIRGKGYMLEASQTV